MRSLRSRQRVHCVSRRVAKHVARGMRHRRMHLARTLVRLIPLLYRSACKWARGRPLWRVITPYRYKDRVSCHSGDEPVVVVGIFFFLSLFCFSCTAKNVRFIVSTKDSAKDKMSMGHWVWESYSIRLAYLYSFRDFSLFFAVDFARDESIPK